MSGATRLLLFDIDGTLMLSRGRGVRAMGEALQQVFELEARDTDIRPQGKTDPVLFGELAAAYALPVPQLQARIGDVHRVYADCLQRSLREPDAVEVMPGVVELLETLQHRPGVALGLVTGNLQTTAWLKLEAAGLASYFASGGFGSDARERRGLVQHALQRFAALGVRCAARHVWVIGDTPDDVASGRAHGTRTLAVATGTYERVALERAEPDVLRDDLRDSGDLVDIFCGPEWQ